MSTWVGREETVQGSLDASHARAVAAMLDDPLDKMGDGVPLPPLWHWFFFPSLATASEVGPDGHPRRGGFLPPIPLPRRMWAGGRVRFLEPLTVGSPAYRHSRVLSVEEKQGRSGPLVLVTVEHRIFGPHGLSVLEEQDLIYRDAGIGAPPAAAAKRATPGASGDALPMSRTALVTPDPVLLFRFSALTFNGHRIHYDHPYATVVEGYPGIVVHGPLTALLLMREASSHVAHPPLAFTYRALAPLFCGESIALAIDGDGEALPQTTARAIGPGGQTAMEATLTWPEGTARQ